MLAKVKLYFSEFFSNMKLQQKLLLSYIIFIIMPLLLLSTLTYSSFSKIIENRALYSAEQSYNQAFSYINDKLYRIMRTSDIITLDKLFNDVVKKKPAQYDFFEQIQDGNDLYKYCKSLEDENDIYKVRLYVNDQLQYSGDNNNIFSLSKAYSSIWYKKLEKYKVKLLWCPPSYLGNDDENNVKVLSAARTVLNLNDFKQKVALMRIDFKEETIQNILSRANSITGSLSYIINSEGAIVTASSYDSLSKYAISPTLIYENSVNSSDWSLSTQQNEGIFYRSMKIRDTDWYMATVIPFNAVYSESKRIRNQILLVIFIISTVAFSFASYVAYSITKRISRIIRRMKDVQSGNLNSIIKTSHRDEIGELIDNYNYMIHQISNLIEERYKAGFDIKNAELKALQAQINPHFLYNTLDMINWLAQKNRSSEIETSVKALAKFYKLSLSRGKEVISIKDELQHVSAYMQIQSMRYPGKLSLSVNVDEGFLDCSILKITLQPIVENSIIHGILRKPEKSGEIIIHGKAEGELLIISVEDDGIGMTEEILSNILTGNVASSHGSGYGIKNVNDRIKLFYGNEFGLSYKSKYGKGTTVEIKIPLIGEDK